MKKIFKVLLVVFSLLIITGCDKKNVKVSDDNKSKLQENIDEDNKDKTQENINKDNNKNEKLENIEVKFNELTELSLVEGTTNIKLNNKDVVLKITKKSTKDYPQYSMYLDNNLVFENVYSSKDFEGKDFYEVMDFEGKDFDEILNYAPSSFELTKIIGKDNKEYLVFIKSYTFSESGGVNYYIIGNNKKILAELRNVPEGTGFEIKGSGKEKYYRKYPNGFYYVLRVAIYNNKIYYLGSEKKVYIDGNDNEKEQLLEYVINIKNDVVTSSKTGVKFTIYDFSGAAGGYLELPYLEIKK